MTIPQLTAALDLVKQTGTVDYVSVEAAITLHAFGWIDGSEGNDAGVYVTLRGRCWLARVWGAQGWLLN